MSVGSVAVGNEGDHSRANANETASSQTNRSSMRQVKCGRNVSTIRIIGACVIIHENPNRFSSNFIGEQIV
jgi:hypothetical protein